MGIYIKGMEMPKSCFQCKFRVKINPDDIECAISQKTFEERFYHIDHRDQSCPIIDVQTHGRLIDADELIDAIERTEWFHQAPNKEMVHGANSAEHQAWYKEQDVYYAVENAPTIIPAELPKEEIGFLNLIIQGMKSPLGLKMEISKPSSRQRRQRRINREHKKDGRTP